MRPLAPEYVERSLWETKGRVSNLERRPPPQSAEYEIKLYDDTKPAVATTGKFVFAIPEDLDGLYLLSAEGFVSTASSTASSFLTVRNVTQGLTMLSTPISIDVGEFVSYFAATRSVVNLPNSQVAKGDRIAIDVLVANTGQGAGVILRFGVAEPVIAPLAAPISTSLAGSGAVRTTLVRRSTTYGYF